MGSPEHPTAHRILKQALDLFSRKGYDATSVREICEASRITKPTLYHFYGSKDGVYRALVEGALERFRADVVDLLAAGGTARERLRRLARRYFEIARDNQELMRFMMRLLYSRSSSVPTAAIHRFYEGVVALVAQSVDEGVARGELRPGPTDVRMLVLMGALGECLHGSLLTGRPALAPELADALVDNILEGWTERR